MSWLVASLLTWRCASCPKRKVVIRQSLVDDALHDKRHLATAMAQSVSSAQDVEAKTTRKKETYSDAKWNRSHSLARTLPDQV